MSPLDDFRPAPLCNEIDPPVSTPLPPLSEIDPPTVQLAFLHDTHRCRPCCARAHRHAAHCARRRRTRRQTDQARRTTRAAIRSAHQHAAAREAAARAASHLHVSSPPLLAVPAVRHSCYQRSTTPCASSDAATAHGQLDVASSAASRSACRQTNRPARRQPGRRHSPETQTRLCRMTRSIMTRRHSFYSYWSCRTQRRCLH
ncbi:hypothetical protein GQ600_15819 [Phytophthora cactorum]|nr:hypothetical protein GQ600_15819 [Phytophthora cactorum]